MNRKVVSSLYLIFMAIYAIVVIGISVSNYKQTMNNDMTTDIYLTETENVTESHVEPIKTVIPATPLAMAQRIELSEATTIPTEPETEPNEEIMQYVEPIVTQPAEGEYYAAEQVYSYFSNLGYSHASICGILGNMMAECGGQTLNLIPEIYDPSGTYYGLCQWGPYYPDIHGGDLNSQIEFLANTIGNEFDNYGYIFGCSMEEFKSLDDPSLAALYFAQIYERCGEGSYWQRQCNAQVAYEYFM